MHSLTFTVPYLKISTLTCDSVSDQEPTQESSQKEVNSECNVYEENFFHIQPQSVRDHPSPTSISNQTVKIFEGSIIAEHSQSDHIKTRKNSGSSPNSSSPRLKCVSSPKILSGSSKTNSNQEVSTGDLAQDYLKSPSHKVSPRFGVDDTLREKKQGEKKTDFQLKLRRSSEEAEKKTDVHLRLKVPHLNISALTCDLLSDQNTTQKSSMKGLTSDSNSYGENFFHQQLQPKITVSDHPSPTRMSNQTVKIFEGPITAQTTNQSDHIKERKNSRGSPNSSSSELKSVSSPRVFTGSPRTRSNPEVSTKGVTQEYLKSPRPEVEDALGEKKQVEKKTALISKLRRSSEDAEKKPGIQSRIRRSSNEFFEKKLKSSSPKEKKDVVNCEIQVFDKLTKIFGKEAKAYDQSFLAEWEKHKFPASMPCNFEEMATCAENLVRTEISSTGSKGLSVFEQSAIQISPRSIDLSNIAILKSLQKKLVHSCSIFRRLHHGMEFILKHANEHQGQKTFFTEKLYSAYKELITVIEMQCDYFGPYSNLRNFLSCQSLIDCKSFNDLKQTNASELSTGECKKNIKKANENIQKVIDKIYVNIENKKLIFDYLNSLDHLANDFLFESEEKITKIKENCTRLRNALSYDHIWKEPVDHEFKIASTIDKISLKDVIQYYLRHRNQLPIMINIARGEDLISHSIINVELPDSDFWFLLFSKLYEALGFEVDAASLRKQTEFFKSYHNEWEQGAKEKNQFENEDRSINTYYSDMLKELTPQTLQCLRLLKLGTINCWQRGAYYWKLRYGGLSYNDFEFDIKFQENVSLAFNIDRNNPKNTFVEQVKHIKICNKKDFNLLYSTIPVSWKAFIPKNEYWKFALSPLKIEVYSDVGRADINKIEQFLIKFNKDTSINPEHLANGGIKIKAKFNKDRALTMQGLQILPAKNQSI